MAKKILEINEDTARRLYPSSSVEMKAILEDTFGKPFFSQKITDIVKSFEDALALHGKVSDNLQILFSYNGVDREMVATVAFAKLSLIRKVLNEGWEPNWENSKELEYYAWFNMSSGVGLSYYDYGYACSSTHVGSRLVFKTKDLAEYAAKQFKDLYQDLMVL